MTKNRNRRRLVICALLALTSPLVCELAVRTRAWVKYGSHRDIYGFTHQIELPGGGLLRAVQPNVDLEFARRSRITSDSRGFRSPELADPKPAHGVRVAFLGGSTTFAGQARSNAETWPALTVDALAAAHPELFFEYVNAGVTGSSLADSLASLRHRLAPIEPDVVVITHAAKDLADDTRELARSQGLNVDSLADGESWLDRHSEAWRLLRLNLWFLRSQDKGRAEEQKLEFDAEALAVGFEQRLTHLAREASEVADIVVLVTFPTKVRRDQPLETQLVNLQQAFTFTPYLTPDGVLRAYSAYNDAIARVAAATGAVLVEGHDDIPGTDEYFSDSVHFTERGYEAMAERVSTALLSAAPFAAWVESKLASR